MKATEGIAMLTIRRSPGEAIVIGDSIVITVLEIDTERVRLVIENRDEDGDVRIVDCLHIDHGDCDVDPGGDGI